MKTAYRPTFWVLLCTLSGWAVYAFWKESCGCSTVPPLTVISWVRVALLVGAASGAILGMGLSLLFRSHLRVGVVEVVSAILLLSAGGAGVLGRAALKTEGPKWWIRPSELSPVHAKIRAIEKIIKNRARNSGGETELAVKGGVKVDHQ